MRFSLTKSTGKTSRGSHLNTLADRFRDDDTGIVKDYTGERRAYQRSEERRGTGNIHSHSSTSHPSPLKLVLITIVSIFIAESVVMSLLYVLPPVSNELAILIDSSLLIVLVLLPIYFFFMKPMKSSLAELKVLEDKQRTLSLTDELTGLYNRRGLFTFAEHALKTAKRGGKELCVFYADMDNLKKINDDLGHKEGDKALISISNILKTTFRESDIIARIGGDEFVIIQIGTNMESVGFITKRLGKRIDEHNDRAPEDYSLSISIGTVFSDSEVACSIDELLAKADRLMYDQKSSKSYYN